MKNVIHISTGPMVPSEQDFIASLHPFMYEIKEAYERWARQLEELRRSVTIGPDGRLESESWNGKEVMEVPDNQPTPVKKHEELFHVCYPITSGGKLPNDDNAGVKSYENLSKLCDKRIGNLWTDANYTILMMLFKAMADHEYIRPEHMQPLRILFGKIIEYNDTFHGAVTNIEFKTVLNRDQKKPALILQISSFADIPNRDRRTWDVWWDTLKGSNISLAFKQMVAGMDTYRDNTDHSIIESDTNWSFQLSRNELTGSAALVLLSCKEINTGNTYGLTIFNKSFTLNTASNIKMQIAKGSEFRFVATIKDALLGAVTVQTRGGAVNTISCNDQTWIGKLKEYGIVIENIQISSMNEATYNFMIENQTRDLTISISEVRVSQVDTFIPKVLSNTVALNRYTLVKPARTVTATNAVNNTKCGGGFDRQIPNVDIPFVLNFPVSVGIYDPSRIKAYALPIIEYDNPSVTDGINATELEIGAILPSIDNGFLQMVISVNHITEKHINNGKVLLLRVVFQTGALSVVSVNTDGSTIMVNSEVACQLEIDMDTGKISTYYSSFTYGITGTRAWHPLSLACIACNSLGILGFPYGVWTMLNALDRCGTLTLKSEYTLEDVQKGIPTEFSQYRSCDMSIPIDDDNYFGVVRIPYAINNAFGLQIPNPTLVSVDKITVKSKVRQLFSINCSSCAYDDNTKSAIYIHPKLVYDQSGYLLLPIFFSNIDEVEIRMICADDNSSREFTINVDLGELTVDPETPEEPDDNKDETGDGNDTDNTENGNGNTDDTDIGGETPPDPDDTSDPVNPPIVEGGDETTDPKDDTDKNDETEESSKTGEDESTEGTPLSKLEKLAGF